jgi:hypothetical protein
MNKQWLKVVPAVILAGGLLSGCESTWERMADEELAMKSSECMATEPGPAMAQVCANVERECQRRRQNKNYVC